MKIKAVFFDRDNTITHKNQEVYDRYISLVESLSHKPFLDDKNKMFKLFDKIKQMGFNTNTIENEIEFYKEYYKQVLIRECGTFNDKIEQVALQIFNMLWLNERALFDDVVPVLKELKNKNIKIGIISDTTLSLPYTIKALGIDEYIDCYTSSKEVGVMKPNPQIYLTALNKLKVKPNECIYIDDYEEEVVGAEKLGIISSRIKRSGEKEFNHDIQNLMEILNFID